MPKVHGVAGGAPPVQATGNLLPPAACFTVLHQSKLQLLIAHVPDHVWASPSGGYTTGDLSTRLAVALNIRNAEADNLAAEVASLAGETKTEAVILALKERLQRLQRQSQVASGHQSSLVNQLNQIALRCAARATHDDRPAEEILGYDANGLPS